MATDLFLWNTSKAFASGKTENLVQLTSHLILGTANAQYLSAGCYTTPEQPCAPFTSLIASWNTDTPKDTAVETQVRVRVQGQWSRWVSYGKWSPYINRQSIASQEDELINFDTDTLTVKNAVSDAFQLRIFLYSNGNATATPKVKLLAATIKLVRKAETENEPLARTLPVPAYSQLLREPLISQSIAAPTAITMLMNRFGEDALPEEFALSCYDSLANTFNNISFNAALAGSYGYDSYVQYGDLHLLKYEIKHGFACAAVLSYTNDENVSADEKIPYVANAPQTAINHVVVVRGFEVDAHGTEYILVNDSLAATNHEAERKYTVNEFLNAWNGITYILQAKRNKDDLSTPTRIYAELRKTQSLGEYSLFVHGNIVPLAQSFKQKNGNCTGSICCALQEPTAFATTAHKTFIFGDVCENGNIKIDLSQINGSPKLTFFVIDNAGTIYVSDLYI